MSKKVVSKRKALAKSQGAKLLNSTSYESGFHFFTAIGNYTGITATSLSEFAAKLQTVPAESVDFHFQRKDFQKWIAETIGDKELADRISLFGATRSGEDLRNEMIRVVQERIAELKGFSVTSEDIVVRTPVPLQL